MRPVTPEEIKDGQTVYFCMIPGKTHEMKATVVQDYTDGDQDAIIFWENGDENDMIPIPLTHLYAKED